MKLAIPVIATDTKPRSIAFMEEFLSQRIQCEDSLVVWIVRSDHDGLMSSMSCEDIGLVTDGIEDLSDRDLERWHRYRTAYKKNQFLMSRRAISFILMKEFGPHHQFAWEGVRGECPRLLDVLGQDVAAVSLSHAENVVVVGIDHDRHSIGVDCEFVTSIAPETLLGYFANEVAPFAEGDSTFSRQWRAAIYWTEFEANWKMLQNLELLHRDSDRSLCPLEAGWDRYTKIDGRCGPPNSLKWRVDLSPDVILVHRLTPDLTFEASPVGGEWCVCCVRSTHR